MASVVAKVLVPWPRNFCMLRMVGRKREREKRGGGQKEGRKKGRKEGKEDAREGGRKRERKKEKEKQKNYTNKRIVSFV